MRKRRADSLDIRENELEIIKLLRAQEAAYLVIGGHAMRFYGAHRETEDLDLLISNDLKSAGKVFRVIEDLLGCSPQFTGRDLALPRKRVDLRPNGFWIDILTSVEGLDFERAFGARKTGVQADVEIPIVSTDDLLFIKRAAVAKDESRREKETRDIEFLEALGK